MTSRWYGPNPIGCSQRSGQPWSSPPSMKYAFLAEVDDFVQLISAGAGKFPCVVVPTWTIPPSQRGHGLVDSRRGGIAWTLTLADRRLASALGEVPNVFVLDAQRGIALTERTPTAIASTTSARSRSSTRSSASRPPRSSPPSRPCRAPAQARRRRSRQHPVGGRGRRRRLAEELRLGGHDHVGEAYVSFPARAEGASRTAACSWRSPARTRSRVALEAIDRPR